MSTTRRRGGEQQQLWKRHVVAEMDVRRVRRFLFVRCLLFIVSSSLHMTPPTRPTHS